MSPFVYALLVIFVILPLMAVWLFCLFHILARPDLRIWQKALWAVGVFVFPLVGAIAYLYAWKKHGPIDETQKYSEMSAEDIEDAIWRSQHSTSSDRIEHTRLQ